MCVFFLKRNSCPLVIARYVQPMGMFINDALAHRKFRNTTPEELGTATIMMNV